MSDLSVLSFRPAGTAHQPGRGDPDGADHAPASFLQERQLSVGCLCAADRTRLPVGGRGRLRGPALVLVAARPAVGERVGRRQIAWTVLAVAGVSVIVAGGGSRRGGRATGDLLAVGSLLCWSAYFVVAKRASARVQAAGHDAFEYTADVTLVAAAVASLVMLAVGQSPARIHAEDWIWIGLLAVIPTGSHLLTNWAHRYLDVSVSSVIGSSNPAASAD